MASSGIRIVNLPEFRQVLNEYRKYSKRDISTILNTKAFYIARGAVRNTHKTAAARIRGELRAQSIGSQAPIGALIINKRRGAAGLPGLYGQAMKDALKSLVNSRIRARAFIASGFIAAIRAFEGKAERKGSAPRSDKSVKEIGRAKGSAKVANEQEWVQLAVIENSASAKRDTKDALTKYGGAALQQAFADEVASMKQYIEDKLSKRAKEFSKH